MRTTDLATNARAETLRRNQTEPEQKLWHRVRDRRLAGHKFTRQYPVGPFFADFACREAKLIVELDGSQHGENAYDERRDMFLVDQGYSVLRFWNFEVLQSMDMVCETILAAIDGHLEAYDRYKPRKI